jgi:hypothetical protein
LGKIMSRTIYLVLFQYYYHKAQVLDYSENLQEMEDLQKKKVAEHATKGDKRYRVWIESISITLEVPE